MATVQMETKELEDRATRADWMFTGCAMFGAVMGAIVGVNTAAAVLHSTLDFTAVFGALGAGIGAFSGATLSKRVTTTR